MAKDPKDYFIDQKRNFKLLRGSFPFQMMSKKTKLIIMSSGTPTTSLICKNFTRIEAPHSIPVPQRRVFYTPVGKMSKDNQDKTIPLMAKRILEIHKTYPKNTIVHTHSYGLVDKFRPYMKQSYVLFQEKDMREEALEQFLEADECIWFSVGYGEGLNLEGKKFQRNVIAKVPYPGLGDEWVQKRNQSDEEKMGINLWYRIQTLVNIQQASSRCTRGPKDYSEAYILDSNFGFFYKQNRKFFENWFKQALVFGDKCEA